MRRAFRLAYDGRPYRGFQRQPDVPTVEDALLRALRDLGVRGADGGPPPGYAAAGRTDAGVSALAQTVALDCPDWLTPRALNGGLPAPIRAWASAPVPDDFHATHDARARTYVYHLYAPAESTETRAGSGAMDEAHLRAAADRLAGDHDVHNLTPDDRRTVRAVAIDVRRDGAFLELRFRAAGFPRQYVRRAVTLLRDVGTGERPPAAVERVLGPDPIDGDEGIAPADPEPLVLVAVEYDVDFDVDDAAAAAARSGFERRHVAHRSRARVAGTLANGIGPAP